MHEQHIDSTPQLTSASTHRSLAIGIVIMAMLVSITHVGKLLTLAPQF